MKRWRLKPFVRVEAGDAEHMVLSWLGQKIVIPSPVASAIPEVLDSLREPRTIEELSRHFAPRWPAESVRALIEGLDSFRLLELIDASDKAANLDFSWASLLRLYSSSTTEIEKAAAVLSQLKVEVVTTIQTPEHAILPALKPRFVAPEDWTERGWFSVLLIPSADERTMSKLARRCFDTRAQVLPVFIDLHGAIVGPMLGQRGQACLECLSRRLKAGENENAARYELSSASANDVAHAWPPTFWKKLDAIIEEEIVKLHVLPQVSSIDLGAYIFDFLNHRAQYEEVFPVPGCFCSVGYDNDLA